MVRGLILYYLNIKPTHGYEIQRFIQISGMDNWAKVQSGSIYYALNKLEKEKHIQVLREERTGSRIRKIYEITESGRQELSKEMREELATPIMETGSLKYIIYPMISVLPVPETRKLIEKHISDLQEKKKYWESWQDVKCGVDATKLTRISFDMTIHALEDQIAWHEELLSHLEDYREEAGDMERMIQAFEPDSVTEDESAGVGAREMQERLAMIEKIKESVESDPQKALEELNEIMDRMRKQSK